MKLSHKFIAILFLLLTLSGCVKNTIFETSLNKGATPKPHGSLMVFTSDINATRGSGSGQGQLLRWSRQKMKSVDGHLVEKLNTLGISAIHETGKFDKQTIAKLKEKHPNQTAALVSTFKSHSRYGSSQRMKVVYRFFDLELNTQVATINADLKSSVDLINNISELNAGDILKELQAQNLICCAQ